MEDNRELQEQLLQAWLEMSACIRGNRILSRFSLNEIMVCSLLYRRQQQGGPPLTATELCQHTRLLKSQMNHILSSMEARSLIQRTRSSTDRRVVGVTLREDAIPLYLQEHASVMQIVHAIFQTLGAEKARELTSMIMTATAVADEYQRSSI